MITEPFDPSFLTVPMGLCVLSIHEVTYTNGTLARLVYLLYFRYKFKADNSGTHWWHSHTGLQLGDGLHGPFIVRDPPATTPGQALYDTDTEEHVMMVSAWSDQGEIMRYMEEMQDQWRVPVPINGTHCYLYSLIPIDTSN